MRTKGAKSKHGNYVSIQSLNKKAFKTMTLLNDFIEKSLRNGYFNKVVDYDLLNKASDCLKELSTIDPQSLTHERSKRIFIVA